jgi:hypothetical protein
MPLTTLMATLVLLARVSTTAPEPHGACQSHTTIHAHEEEEEGGTIADNMWV